ncbi:MAG: YkgJ family cysteine cluster protein [Anaerolineae bacterium]|nr:YkgJ family cysteine cluster protein [Anaerolineae bacterium]
MTTPTPRPDSDATTLCLACGFCCDGTLHTHTVILAGEVDAVKNLGLTVGAVQDRPAFQQPCMMFRVGSCSIYERRPHVCRRYECALLKRTLSGEIALEQALRVVGIAQKQLGVFRSRAPDAVSFMRYLKALEAAADAATANMVSADASQEAGPAAPVVLDTEASNHVVALVLYLTRHFGESGGDQ